LDFTSSYNSICDTNAWKAAAERERPAGVFPADIAKAAAELHADRLLDAFIEMSFHRMLELSRSKGRSHLFQRQEFLQTHVDPDIGSPVLDRNRWVLKSRCRKATDACLMQALNHVAQEVIQYAGELQSQHLENCFNAN